MFEHSPWLQSHDPVAPGGREGAKEMSLVTGLRSVAGVPVLEVGGGGMKMVRGYYPAACRSH